MRDSGCKDLGCSNHVQEVLLEKEQTQNQIDALKKTIRGHIKHIRLLQDCDDASAKTIGKLMSDNERLHERLNRLANKGMKDMGFKREGKSK